MKERPQRSGSPAQLQDGTRGLRSGKPRPNADRGPVRILLVEDNDAHALLIEAAIGQAEDCLIERHLTAQSALRAMEELSECDLIIIDVALPGEKGTQLAKSIRGNAGWSGIPIVVFSSSESAADHKAALDAGANSYVVKPLGFDAFESTVKDIVAYWTRLQYTPR